MALEPLQWQIRDLVMGPGTTHRIMDSTNPFALTARADQGGPRAWNHGSWSGAEWANERVVPLRVLVETEALADWLAAHQQLAAAFAPVGDEVGSVELRFEFGGAEYILFGRPRMVEPETDLLGVGKSFTRCAFVAQDPRIYAGTESTTGAIALPSQAGGLLVPGVVSSTPPYGLLLDGTSGGYASTPDAASLDITGDLDVRFDATLDDWTAQAALVTKFNFSGDQRSFYCEINASGRLQIRWTTDGTLATQILETAAVDHTPDPVTGRLAVRWTVDVDDGAGGYAVRFWQAPAINGPWTLLDEQTGAGTTSIHAGTADLHVGANSSGAENPAGTVYAAHIFDGIDGTRVAAPRFETQPDGATSFDDSGGLTWTVNGTASINGRVAGGGLLVPLTIDSTLVGGTAPMVNAGTTAAGVRFRVDGPVPQPRIIVQQPNGVVQDITFVPGFEVAAGQWVEVDTAARTALLNGLPQASVRGQAAWNMDPYPLLPGTSTLRFAADDVAAGTLTATWRSAWW